MQPTSIINIDQFRLPAMEQGVPARVFAMDHRPITLTIRAAATNTRSIRVVPAQADLKPVVLLPEQSIEIPEADLDTWKVFAEYDGDHVVVSGTRAMGN